MLRIHLFSIFKIKTPRALAAPLGLLIVKTLTLVSLSNLNCTRVSIIIYLVTLCLLLVQDGCLTLLVLGLTIVSVCFTFT